MTVSEPTPACPKCSSTSLTASGQGFGGGKALIGAALLGPVGLLAGLAGSGNVRIVCLGCGARSKPGELKIIQPPPSYLPPRDPAEEELHGEAVRERIVREAEESDDAVVTAAEAELNAIMSEQGFSQADVAYFGVEALVGPILAERERQAHENRVKERIEAERLRVAERRAALIERGFDPDSLPTVVPIRTGPEIQPGILKWPSWIKRF